MHIRRGDRLVAVGFTIGAAMILGYAAASAWLRAALEGGAEVSGLVGPIFGTLNAIAFVGSVTLTVGFSSLRAEGPAPWAGLAAIGGGLRALVELTFLVQTLVPIEGGSAHAFHEIGRLVSLGVTAAFLSFTLIFVAQRRIGAGRPAVDATWGIATGAAVLVIGIPLCGEIVGLRGELWSWVTRAAGLGACLGLAAIFWRARATTPLVEQRGVGLAAPGAAAGLRLFGQAMVLRIIILVLVVGLSLLARSSRDLGTMKAVGYGGGVLSMLAALAMLTGLVRFAAATPAGRGGGGLAALCVGGSMLLELWGLVLFGDLFSGRVGRAFDAMDTLPWVQGVGQAVGLIGMLGLLSALAGVAQMGDHPRLAASARGLMVVMVVLLFMALGLKALVTMRSPSVALAIILGIGTLVLAVFALVRLVSQVLQTADLLAFNEGEVQE